MAIQSPKSKRPHAPGENPSSYDNPTEKLGGQTGQQGSSQAKSKAHVPAAGPAGHSGAGQGVKSGYSSVSTSQPAPSQAGSPGYKTFSERDKS